jgi:hypothetical protein
MHSHWERYGNARTALAAGLAALALLVTGLTGCGTEPAGGPADADTSAGEPEPGMLILAKAQFERITRDDGTKGFAPGAAKMVLIRHDGSGWTKEVVEDPDSNVFHKAKPVHLPGYDAGILTIGANAAPKPALLKLWTPGDGGWTGEALAEATFGGKFNRFRDFEIGDVDADDQQEIVIATHDQGVVMVLSRQGDGWQPLEIDRHEDTFVHEIELGDVDRDGRQEIFATPSEPNRVDGTPQPGWVMRYDHTEDGYTAVEVLRLPTRHMKEILVGDSEEDGTLELYASIEATLSSKQGQPTPDEQLEIRRYDPEETSADPQLVASLDDKQCRFLHLGDVDGDGTNEMVATAYRSGIWVLEPGEAAWKPTLVDADSSGYEHASTLADLDGDGVVELYVAADDQGQLRRYVWNGEDFDREEIVAITKGDITFGVAAWPDPPM